MHFFIDTRGVVQRVLVAQTSGHEVLDSAALRVARIFRFTPALNLDEIVPAWVAIPITFATRTEGAEGMPEEVREFVDSIARERAADPGDPPADPAAPYARTEPAAREGSAADPLADLMQAPTFTPHTLRPDLVNERNAQRALEREYPPMLRDAGTGGRVNVQIFVDLAGVVRNAGVGRSVSPRSARRRNVPRRPRHAIHAGAHRR